MFSIYHLARLLCQGQFPIINKSMLMKDKNNMILLDLCLLHLSLINNSSDEHKDLNAKTQHTITDSIHATSIGGLHSLH